jgi:hypothetical protein
MRSVTHAAMPQLQQCSVVKALGRQRLYRLGLDIESKAKDQVEDSARPQQT